MRLPLRRAWLLALLLLLPFNVHAMSLGLGVGGGYWFVGTPQFDVNVALRESLGKHVSAGLRVGFLFNTAGGAQIGAPVDVTLRFNITRVYIDVFGGPTFLFGDSAFLRGRVGMGVGFYTRHFEVGFEGGWLQPSALAMVRFAFRL